MDEQLSRLTPDRYPAVPNGSPFPGLSHLQFEAELYLSVLAPHARPAADRIPSREDTRIRAATAMMRERLADSITLADLGAEVHLSSFHFVRVFKKATGVTPYQYLTRLRIDEAKRLLRHTDLTIDQVAGRCGFASSGALSTAFLRHTGARPSVYRNS
ncbi:helix-turn-helix domain-containing protein [Nocardia sp. CA-128927]|uniref:helix-turn-helix domain-containing protein n=1 Tax=Nocardia sp. CA-128927 TaxID=3239975 RepID=UPI003D96B7E4